MPPVAERAKLAPAKVPPATVIVLPIVAVPPRFKVPPLTASVVPVASVLVNVAVPNVMVRERHDNAADTDHAPPEPLNAN